MIKQSVRPILFLCVGIVVGFYIGKWQHPYNKCAHMYEDPLDISECVWLLENN